MLAGGMGSSLLAYAEARVAQATPDDPGERLNAPPESEHGRTGADRLLWQRTSPDSAIFLPSGYMDRTNQQVIGVVTPRKTFIVVWTMASREANPDQRQVVVRSTDLGKTWSDPLVIDSQGLDKEGNGDGQRAPWGIPFVVPSSGRIYIFYNKNTGQNQVRADTTGVLRFKYSDDDGVSWKDGMRLPIRPDEFSNPVLAADPNWISIYTPVVTRKGVVIAGFGRYKAGPDLHSGLNFKCWETEICFLRFDNILEEADPFKLIVTTLPKGPRGLRVPWPDNPERSWANEPSIIELTDGRLLTAFRTRQSAIYYAISDDSGSSWSKPEPLLYRDNDKIIHNTSAPCPMYKLKDGMIVLMFYNQRLKRGFFGSRDPVYLSIGRETLQSRQPVSFGPPKEFMTVHGVTPPGAPQ